MRDTTRRGARDAFCCLHVRVTLRESTTRATHCHLRRGNCQQNLERTNENDRFKMTALEIACGGRGAHVQAQTIICIFMVQHTIILFSLSPRHILFTAS